MFRLFFVAVMVVSIPVEAQVERYEQRAVRAKLLSIKEGLPAQTIRLVGEGSPRQQEFARFYAEVIHPQVEKFMRLYQRRSALNVLIDTGSYNDAEERTKLQKEFAELSREISAMTVDPEYNGQIKRWGELAHGLDGELANYARTLARENDLHNFPKEMSGTLTQVDLLLQDYKQAIIKAPAASSFSEWLAKSSEIPRLYKFGEITLNEAIERLTELNQRAGGRFVGFDAVRAKGDALNEMAILRTKLAKSKGFATWAAYQLEASGQGYTPEYRGVANQRAFLHAWIEQLRPLVTKFIDKRARELRIDPTRLRRQHVALLTLPDLTLAQPHFPAERLTDIWEETMLESGFKPETLAQILVDDKERPGLKNPTMAYMAGLVTPEASERVLDVTTLNFLAPSQVRPGQMYIMQTYRGAGLGDLRTAFHEGMGHALEYLLKDKEEFTGEAYGYVEVPSMTAEYFLREAEMLHDKASGDKPSVAQFKTWIRNHEKNQGFNLIARAGSALYDIDLWDYDYEAPGAKTYIQRAEEVFNDIEERTGQLPMVEADVPGFYANMSTTHFTSGNVRNIGYSYATIGSEMMAQFLSRELERRTGRASWYKQSGLAELITESFYKKGWRLPFPLNIERITGQKFDMKKILSDLTKDLTCEDDL